jgi:hypothetical protein
MIVAELRSILANLLETEIGTFANGQTATWVEPPAAPSGVTGLECIIGRTPGMLISEALSSYQIYQNVEWTVTLVQFERTDVGAKKFADAICKIRKRFPNHRERMLPFTEDFYPQVTFFINEHAIVNQLR